MKKNQFFFQVLMFVSIVHWGALTHGQNTDIPGQVQKTNENEFVLLEKLKSYMLKNSSHAPQDTREVIQKLSEIGSPSIVQFFLDNITWQDPNGVDVLQRWTIGGRGLIRTCPMGRALESIIEDVPLRLCMDALIQSENGTLKALLIEYVTKARHKENFTREVEKLIETSSDSGRWEIMKNRLENNTILMIPFTPQKTLTISENDKKLFMTNATEFITKNQTANAETTNSILRTNSSIKAGQPTTQDNTTAQSKSFPMVIILFYALLISCASAIFYFMRKRKGKKGT